MTEFNDLDLNTEIPEMDEEEAKKTLSEFMEAHQTNRTAYDELDSELDDIETEYQEELEEKEEMIAEFKDERAEAAAEYVNMPADLLSERFSFSELEQIVEEGAEFSEETEEDADDDADDGGDDSPLTTFSDKPEKGKGGSNGAGRSADREHARSVLQRNGFSVGGGN